MGKSNNIPERSKVIYQRDQSLHDFFKQDEIQILENINDIFINHIKINLFNFTKRNIEFDSYSMQIKSNSINTESIKNFVYANWTEVCSFKNPSVIILSYNFLSAITNVLFGGTNNLQDAKKYHKDMTSTEYFINNRIIELIIKSYSYAYKNFFLINMKFIKVKIIVDFKKINFHSDEMLLIKNFNLIFNKTEIFFSIIIPYSIIKKLHNTKCITLNKDINNHNQKKQKKITLSDISNVKLNIITNLVNISISFDDFDNLSIGDILLIENPGQTISFIGNTPVFLGSYKTCNEKPVIFIKKFINSTF